MSPAGDRFGLEVPGRAEHLATVRIFAASLARRFGMDEDTIADLKLALSEAGTLALRGSAGAEPLRVTAMALEAGLEFAVELGEAGIAADDELGGLELIRALFADAREGPAGVVIPVRSRPR